MRDLRLGDVIDDYCVKCRRLTNHSIVSIVDGEAAKVRCRSCYSDHQYLREQIPPSKKELQKQKLFEAVLAGAGVPDVAEPVVVPEATEAALGPEVLADTKPTKSKKKKT